MRTNLLLSLFITTNLFLFINVAFSQSFSCSIGTPACLDWNDKVVPNSATCFDSFTCNGNFVCQSKYQDVVWEYENLINEFNDLVNRANSKNDSIEELLSLARRHEERAVEYENSYERLKSCIMYADTLDVASQCAYLH